MALVRQIPEASRFRLWVVCVGLGLGFLVLVWRAVDLQFIERGFLQRQGDARFMRDVSVPAHRGMILDRNGEPLAVSSPVMAVWANPSEMLLAQGGVPELAGLLNISVRDVSERLRRYSGKEFVYLKRNVTPLVAEKIRLLGIPGLYLRKEYRRFYPGAEVMAHMIGFTNIDDHGQEGVELSFDRSLSGRAGKRRVIRDRLGRVVEEVESIREPLPGHDLRLSIDRRLQYLAYRELKTAVKLHSARAGSVVLLDARTGEVLAMANQPSFNPNDRSSLQGDRYRNRAVTDVFEPGSTMKPFTIAAALDKGKFSAQSKIDTRPGYYRVSGHMLRDHRNYGVIDLATIIEKSSNVGASKVALSLSREALWRVFDRVGFGVSTQSLLPGESDGQLPFFSQWQELDQATISFGYGLSVTAVQLARAYGIFADHGRVRPVSVMPVEGEGAFEQVISQETARQLLAMMESVVSEKGTGKRAHVPGYRVAGKTGTVRKFVNGAYSDERYVSLFAGVAPASDPRLVMVVAVDEPTSGGFYGGEVAAPVFSSVMSKALWMLGIPPDDIAKTGRAVKGLQT